MKPTTLLCLLLCGSISYSQIVTYMPSNGVIANPERGFYNFTQGDASSINYATLNPVALVQLRNNENLTLIHRGFYLENFLNAPISQSYISNMQIDFDALRSAGMKAIIRFAYCMANCQDATKAQILAHIAQLQPILNENADVICAIEAGFIGDFGEWYQTVQADFGGFGFDPAPSELTPENYSNRREITDALLNEGPSTILIRAAFYKKRMYGEIPVDENSAFTGSANSRIGYHDDSFLDPMGGTYQFQSDYDFVRQETNFVPIGGETYENVTAMNGCDNALPQLANVHWSFLNKNKPLVLANWASGGCLDEIENKLGYRFQLNNTNCAAEANIHQPFNFSFDIQNLGYAAPFSQRTVYLRMINTISGAEYNAPLATDCRRWSPGEIPITENLQLPQDMPAGDYHLYLCLPDRNPSIAARPEYAIRFANEGIWNASPGCNDLNRNVNVSTELTVTDDLVKPTVNIYPVPADNFIHIDIADNSIRNAKIYNLAGQELKVLVEIDYDYVTLSTVNLADGIYTVKIFSDSGAFSRKVIVAHS